MLYTAASDKQKYFLQWLQRLFSFRIFLESHRYHTNCTQYCPSIKGNEKHYIHYILIRLLITGKVKGTLAGGLPATARYLDSKAPNLKITGDALIWKTSHVQASLAQGYCKGQKHSTPGTTEHKSVLFWIIPIYARMQRIENKLRLNCPQCSADLLGECTGRRGHHVVAGQGIQLKSKVCRDMEPKQPLD